ncbi:hypothetical protein pb186bvf_015617 [Paramecium bursaria]
MKFSQMLEEFSLSKMQQNKKILKDQSTQTDEQQYIIIESNILQQSLPVTEEIWKPREACSIMQSNQSFILTQIKKNNSIIYEEIQRLMNVYKPVSEIMTFINETSVYKNIEEIELQLAFYQDTINKLIKGIQTSTKSSFRQNISDSYQSPGWNLTPTLKDSIIK